MLNIFTVDLEDWYCASVMKSVLSRNEWEGCVSRAKVGTTYLLNLLERRGIEATFFVLGYVAEREPDLIRDILFRGHEIATHGFYHQSIGDLTSEEFRRDLERSIATLEGITGQKVQGYRAPDFSLNGKTIKWVPGILAEQGLCYDSSVFPCKSHQKKSIHISTTAGNLYRYNNGLTELPISCVKFKRLTIPATGGAYCRHIPLWLTRWLFQRLNNQKRPVMFYTHPWEYDTAQPVMPLSMLCRIRHYRGIATMPQKLEALTEEFRFTSVRQFLASQEFSHARQNL